MNKNSHCKNFTKQSGELFEPNDIFSDCVLKRICTSTCTFIHFALQTSAGHAAQALNQHKKTVQPQRRLIYL